MNSSCFQVNCPESARITVRNQQEPVSDLRKNHCPEWPGISVRFAQEYAAIGLIFCYLQDRKTEIIIEFRTRISPVKQIEDLALLFHRVNDL